MNVNLCKHPINTLTMLRQHTYCVLKMNKVQILIVSDSSNSPYHFNPTHSLSFICVIKTMYPLQCTLCNMCYSASFAFAINKESRTS